MNPLQSRKQLLLAESELNRALMLEEMAALKSNVHALSAKAKSFRAIASYTAMVVGGLTAFRRGKSAEPAAKPSWWQTILKVAGLISTVWLAIRPEDRDRKGM
jgi:hypothetical protein